MKSDDYQEEALKFAKNVKPIPATLSFMCYAALKLAGESGEVAEKFGKLIRDKDCVITPEFKKDLVKELGDCLWYISVLAHELGYTLEEVQEINLAKLTDREKRGVIQGSGDNR